MDIAWRPFSATRIAAQTFYALGDTRTPVWTGLVSVAANVVLTGIHLMRRSIDGLMDRALPSASQEASGGGATGMRATGSPSTRCARAELQGKSAAALKVNGKSYRVEVEHRHTLAEVLRDQLGLTGTKIGCDRGECGACTVIINGRNMYSCSQLAIWMEGKEILTIEGLAQGDKLDPLQEAFIEHDGPQCGFCTSGQIMSGKALLMKNSKPTEAQARRALSGNLCRCGNYNREVAAVLAAAIKAG